MHNKKKLRNVISVLISFFLTVCIFLLLFCVEIKMGYLGNATFSDSMLESEYVEKAIRAMKQELVAMLAEKGIETELPEEMLENNQCYLVVNNYVRGTLDGKQVSVDAGDFEVKFEAFLNDYLDENEVYRSEGVQSTIDELVNHAGEIYVRYLQPEFAASFRQFQGSIEKPMTVIAVVAVVVAVLLSILLTMMYHYKHRAFRYIAISTITAVIWNAICGILMWNTDVTKGLQIGPEYYLDFLRCYTRNGLQEWWIVCGLGVVLFLGLFAIGKYLKHNTK